jgi:hypothetical protein
MQRESATCYGALRVDLQLAPVIGTAQATEQFGQRAEQEKAWGSNDERRVLIRKAAKKEAC